MERNPVIIGTNMSTISNTKNTNNNLFIYSYATKNRSLSP